MVEQWTVNPEAIGSSPCHTLLTYNAEVAQVVNADGLYP